MRYFLLLFLFSFSVNAVVLERYEFSPKCEMVMTGRAFYLNLCPAGMVMVGANPLPGNPSSIQVLCARHEIRCTTVRTEEVERN